jgi:hypothetical protein
VAGTDLALFLLFPPGITDTELEANIDFEEKNGFLIEERRLRWCTVEKRVESGITESKGQ